MFIESERDLQIALHSHVYSASVFQYISALQERSLQAQTDYRDLKLTRNYAVHSACNLHEYCEQTTA